MPGPSSWTVVIAQGGDKVYKETKTGTLYIDKHRTLFIRDEKGDPIFVARTWLTVSK